MEKSVTKTKDLLKSDNKKRVFYMKINIHTWSYIAQFFLEMFQTNVVEKIKTRFMLNNFFFSTRKSCHLWDNVGKPCRAGQTTDGNIIRRMRIACCITKARIQKRILNVWYSLLSHCNNGFVRAPLCSVYTYIVCLVFKWHHINLTKHWLLGPDMPWWILLGTSNTRVSQWIIQGYS